MPKRKPDRELLSFVEDLKRQWVATLDALVDPLIIVDSSYKILKSNKAMAEKCGLGVKDVIGQKCFKVFAGRKSPCVGCKMADAFDKKKPQSFDLTSVKERFYEVTSQPMIGEKGNIDAVVHVYHDRTEARHLRLQLMQSEKLSSIGLLAGGIAHEINNPLGGILVFSQMLAKELPADSPQQSDVHEIINAAQRCKSIVENLLDFARTNSSVKNKKPEIFSASDALATALRFAKVGIPRHLVEIEEDYAVDGAKVKGDRNRLIQVFLNLIQNAVQAMPKGGTLTLRSYVDHAEESQAVACFEISDTGIGIAPSHLNKIFDPFFTTKEPGEGTGLGLAICYGIIEEFEGSIEVKSRVKHGTKFIVRLPTSEKAVTGTVGAA